MEQAHRATGSDVGHPSLFEYDNRERVCVGESRQSSVPWCPLWSHRSTMFAKGS
jgi:hypothetical protein